MLARTLTLRRSTRLSLLEAEEQLAGLELLLQLVVGPHLLDSLRQRGSQPGEPRTPVTRRRSPMRFVLLYTPLNSKGVRPEASRAERCR